MRTILFAISLIGYNVLLAQYTSEEFKSAIEKARFLVKTHQQMTGVPGVQTAVIVDGKLVWSEGFGYSDIKENKSVTTDTKFRIASVSKSVTSMAFGRLIENNQLDIDEDIRAYVPEFPQKSFPITARQLAASVAGVRHYTSKDPTYRTTHYPTVIDALEVFDDDPLDFEPNTRYQYSSFGWVLLSAAMQRASGQSFFELMENSWQELTMNNTSFDYPNKAIANKSTFYVLGKKDRRVEAPHENRSYMYAGGGYLSTAEDLVKMGQKLITDQYISIKTRELLTTTHVLEDGDTTHYGLGWETGTSRFDVPIIFHGGSMQTARSHLVIYPEQKVVFAYLANTGDQIFFNDREAQNIAEIFVNKQMNIHQESKDRQLVGEWKISTTSLRGKSSTGTLSLQQNEHGLTVGTITFTRSKKKGTYPVVVTGSTDDYYHLIAVSPMFIDLYIQMDGNNFSGTWLHDFNVKGIPEEDEYWDERKIIGTRIK